MPRRAFKRLQDELEDIDTDLVDGIELAESSSTPLNTAGGPSGGGGGSGSSGRHAILQSPVSDRGGSRNALEAPPRRSMHQVDMDLEWPMIDIPQELREIRDGGDDFNTRSNSQANAIRVRNINKLGKKNPTLTVERRESFLSKDSREPRLSLWDIRCTGSIEEILASPVRGGGAFFSCPGTKRASSLCNSA